VTVALKGCTPRNLTLQLAPVATAVFFRVQLGAWERCANWSDVHTADCNTLECAADGGLRAILRNIPGSSLAICSTIPRIFADL